MHKPQRRSETAHRIMSNLKRHPANDRQKTNRGRNDLMICERIHAPPSGGNHLFSKRVGNGMVEIIARDFFLKRTIQPQNMPLSNSPPRCIIGGQLGGIGIVDIVDNNRGCRSTVLRMGNRKAPENQNNPKKSRNPNAARHRST